MEDYEKKIRVYVEKTFENVPNNRKAQEFKEELLSNLLDRYNDLIDNKTDEEEAYNRVISSVGDIDELFEDNPIKLTKENWDRKKGAKITAIAVMMYILCPVSVIALSDIGYDNLGVIIMFILIAGATGLLIYNNMIKPQYLKQDDTLVEEFKEWKSVTSKSRKTMKSIISAMWSIIVAVYLLLSFTTGAWNITWIIFIIGAALGNIIKAYFEYKEMD